MASPDDFSIQLPQHALEEGSHNGKASHIRLLFPSLAAILLILQSILIFLLWSMLSASTSSYLLDCPDLIEKRWKRDTSYMSLDHKYDYLWNETGQSALIFDDQKSVVQITMFHQLHCLASLRKALQEASLGHDIGIDHRADTHWPHCMHFLREAILCNADGTLERPGYYPNGTGQTFINGYGDTRYCRSSEELYRLRETNRLYESSGILAS